MPKDNKRITLPPIPPTMHCAHRLFSKVTSLGNGSIAGLGLGTWSRLGLEYSLCTVRSHSRVSALGGGYIIRNRVT